MSDTSFAEISEGYHPATDAWHPNGFGSPGAHGEVQRSLARWLRESGWLVYTEIEIPSLGRRVDLVALKPHNYARREIRAYEVKGTRADWLREMASLKYVGLQEHFTRTLFAFPAGVAKAGEVPPECGVAIRGNNGWSHIRNGRGGPTTKVTINDLLALLSRGYEEHREARDLRARLIRKDGDVDLQAQASRAGYAIGRRLASKTPPLDPELRELRHLLEEALGVELKRDQDVNYHSQSIRRFLRALQEWQRHGEALMKIGQYLVDLHQPWSQIGADAGVVEHALTEIATEEAT
mgnify:FL=1